MTEQHHPPISIDEMAHAFEDEGGPVDLSHHTIEDWLTLAVFWAMAVCVFLQFFTRYALNNSLAWTEEIAANCLVIVVFLGSAMCVRMGRHIAVDLIYNFLPRRVGRGLEVAVDVICIGFYGYMAWLMWRYIDIVGSERMVTVDLPRGFVFYTVFAAFALMLLRSVQNFIKDLTGRKTVREEAAESARRGYDAMLLLIGSFLLLMVIGVPVAVAMAVASLAYIGIYNVAPDIIAAQRMIAGVESFPLIAVPFFILAGNLMNIAGVTGRIYHFALSLVGWMKGGLAQVNIIGSVVFSGMSGTALADAAGIGTIEIKAMKDHGYPVEAAVGVTAASATLGPIFPPSLPFVIYGMMANASIGALFMAGILPGIVMTSLMMLTVYIFARRFGWGSDTPFDIRQLMGAGLEIVVVMCFPLAVWLLVMAGLSINIAVLIALVALVALDWYFDWHAVMALMAPVLLIGGMTMGWFTPTEAAVAAVIWTLFLGLVRYRTMTWRTLAKASFDTIETTASVLFIVTAASIFAWLLTVSQAAQLFSDAMFGLTDNWWTFLIIVNVILLVVGAFLDTIAAISILVPILMPVAARYGIDPVHLGVILTLNLMIGLLTPPVGMVLFVLSRIAKMSVERTALAILPWMIPLFVALLLITFIPALTLWLPTQLGLIR